MKVGAGGKREFTCSAAVAERDRESDALESDGSGDVGTATWWRLSRNVNYRYNVAGEILSVFFWRKLHRDF